MAWLARFLALVVCFTALATAVGAAEVKGKELELCGTFSNIFQYTLRVEIGTPPVPFDLTFDTGSSDILAPRFDCSTCYSDNFYNPSKSSTSQSVACPSKTFTCPSCTSKGECQSNPSFVGIQEKAIVTIDNVGIQAMDRSFESVQMGFGAVTYFNMSQSMSVSARPNLHFRAAYRKLDSNYPSGIVGFAYASISSFKGATYMDNLVSNGIISSDLMAFCLNPIQGGVLSVGKIAPYFTGSIKYTPQARVGQSGFYEVEMIDLKVGGRSLGLNPSIYNTQHCIVDTGTPVPTLPTKVYSAIAASIQTLCSKGHHLVGVCGVSTAKNIFAGQCYAMTEAQIAAFPTISFELARGIPLDYTPSQYLRPMYFCQSSGAILNAQANTTMVGLALQEDSSSFGSVIGATLLQSYMTVLDRKNREIGFAQVSACPSPVNCDI